MKKSNRMNIFTLIGALVLALSLVLSGCSNTDPTKATEKATEEKSESSSETKATEEPSDIPSDWRLIYSSQTAEEPKEVHPKDADALKATITAPFALTTQDGKVSQNGNVYTVTAAGEYTASGLLSEGSIVIDAGDDDEITIIFSYADISSSTTAPIVCLNADRVKLKFYTDTYNVISDNRTWDAEADEKATQNGTFIPSGAIYSDCDLDITGKGSVVINASYQNGIHTKKDLTVKNVTMKLIARETGLKGKDSVTIESGNLTLISQQGDGIQTRDSDISSKGNQRGTVSVLDGVIDIYAAGEGMDCAYNAEISGGTVNIYTAEYSNYSTEPEQSGTDFYLVISSYDYSDEYKYYAYYYNDDREKGVFKKAVFDTMLQSQRATYYGLLSLRPDGYANVAFFRFAIGTEANISEYDAASDGNAVNSQMNGVLLSFDGDEIDADWVTVQIGTGGNSNKSVDSSKGIKASNAVIISGGTTVIKCQDDGIHAHYTETLENGEDPLGNVVIIGGKVFITAADDGIHADQDVLISGGYVRVLNAYEGIEGNRIMIDGGSTFVYASDDGLNAYTGTQTPVITVSGGYLDVTTPSGDTDAVDSNGSYAQSGGFVIIKGGNTQGTVAGSLDVERTVTVTGGTLIALGGICETPEDSVNAYAHRGVSFSTGTYKLLDGSGAEVLEFTLTESYSSYWIASENLITGTKYTIQKDGSTVDSWTQEKGTQGDTGGGFGGGGFGGPGRR